MNDNALQSEADIVYDATKDIIARTRRVLLLVSGLAGLGFFYLFWWYGSWELARIDARHAVAATIQRMNAQGETATGDFGKDKSSIDTMEKEAYDLENEWANKHFDVPLIGLKIASADFSQAILIFAGTVLLWLVFYQRRLNACLIRLAQLEGWARVVLLLEHHFTLLGRHATPLMRYIARALLLALPLLAISFFISDFIDLRNIASTPIKQFAFTSNIYKIRVGFRMGIDFFLTLLVCWAGLRCYREFRNIEDNLLREISIGDSTLP